MPPSLVPALEFPNLAKESFRRSSLLLQAHLVHLFCLIPASGILQPCSEFSCIALTTASAAGCTATPMWLPFHSSRRGVPPLLFTNQTDAPL